MITRRKRKERKRRRPRVSQDLVVKKVQGISLIVMGCLLGTSIGVAVHV